jgi:uncharacterized protein (TIGR00369 family)
MTNEISPSLLVSPYADDLSVTLHRSDAEAASDADVAIALPFEERNTMHGVLHGGALASLVPISAFAAIHRATPAADPCTVSLHVEYARAARKPVVAQTRAVRQVRELAFFETRMVDGEGNVVYTPSVPSSIASTKRALAESTRLRSRRAAQCVGELDVAAHRLAYPAVIGCERRWRRREGRGARHRCAVFGERGASDGIAAARDRMGPRRADLNA